MRFSEAVGSSSTGPAPQITRLAALGENINDMTVSLRFQRESGPSVLLGMRTSGTMVRVMRFQSSLSVNGMTGCRLSV